MKVADITPNRCRKQTLVQLIWFSEALLVMWLLSDDWIINVKVKNLQIASDVGVLKCVYWTRQTQSVHERPEIPAPAVTSRMYSHSR